MNRQRLKIMKQAEAPNYISEKWECFMKSEKIFFLEILFVKQQWAVLTAVKVEQNFWFFMALLWEGSLKWITNGKKTLA